MDTRKPAAKTPSAVEVVSTEVALATFGARMLGLGNLVVDNAFTKTEPLVERATVLPVSHRQPSAPVAHRFVRGH